MNKQIEEKKKLFEDAWRVRTDFEKEDFKLRQRAEQAKKDIIKLQEETEKLKEKRPALLADNKDVKKLNKRLKDIEEEIEINNDLITGITAKREKRNNDVRNIRYHVNQAYKAYINEILATLKDKYMKLAPEFADLLTDIIALEAMRNGDRDYPCSFHYDDIMKLPNLDDEKHPFFTYNYYGIHIDNYKRMEEKYNIPQFEQY